MSPSSAEQELRRNLADPLWRLSHLYWITDKRGQRVLFTPNEAQVQFLREIHYNNCILKARQMGFSTLIQLIMLDACLFIPGTQAAVIAHTQAASSKIFRRVIKYAYDNLPLTLRAHIKRTGNSATELTFANGSAISVTTSARSDVLQYLHVSEYGKICARDPNRAYEIMTGSIPTVAKGGFVFVESTAEGREGQFYDMCNAAQERAQMPSPLGMDDYAFHFFAWWGHSRYKRSDPSIILTDEDLKYFAEVTAQTHVELTLDQKRWYCQKLRKSFGGERDAMRREYPSWAEEAFLMSKSGAFYATQLAAARKEGRIGSVPWDPRYPVNTFWDCGGDGTAIWFHQRIRGADRMIDYQETFAEPYQTDVKLLLAKPYRWGVHYLPHDAANRPKQALANLSAQQQLEDLGLRNTEIVPCIAHVIDGIQATRNRFACLYIDQDKCAIGIDHLTRYRKRWSPQLAGFTDDPLHDVHSHGSDALRQWGQTEPVDEAERNLHLRQRSGV